MMVPTRRKFDGRDDWTYQGGKKFLVIDGPMPRKTLADTRESTAHQYWNPQDLRNVVEGIEPKSNRSLVIALWCFGLTGLGVLAWWWL